MEHLNGIGRKVCVRGATMDGGLAYLAARGSGVARPPQSAPKAELDVDYGVLSGSSAFVAMMESARFRERDDVALLWWLHPPPQRGILF